MADNGYKTRQREEILRCLKKNSSDAVTVDRLVELLKADGVSVGRTTVYRFIDRLVKSGDVRRFLDGDGKSATYQFVEHKHECLEHMHLKCEKCGRLEHLSCDFMSGVCAHITEHHGFCVDNSKTTIFGICRDCMEKGETESCR